MNTSLEAWLIHKKNLGEKSRQLILFTEKHGLIEAFFPGGPAAKTQIFTPLWVCLDLRQERYYVRRIESTTASLPLKGEALFSGFYLNELLYYLLAPLAPDAELFQAYVLTLNQLPIVNTRENLEALLRRFEWRLLCSCGYGFSLSTEANGLAIDPAAYYQWLDGEGFILSKTGMPGSHILALAEDNLSSKAYLKSAKQLMRQALNAILGGRELKARSMFGSSVVTK